MSTESRVMREQMHLYHQPCLMAENSTRLATTAFLFYASIISSTHENNIAPSYNVTATIPCCSHFCKSWKRPSPKQVQHVGNRVLLPSTINIFYLHTGKIMSIQRSLSLLRENLYITVHMGPALLGNQPLGQSLFLLVREASMSSGPTNLTQMGQKINLPAKSVFSSFM